MDDTTLVYNINLCCICQNPQSLELFNTTTNTNVNNRTYVEIVNSLFIDIVWIDEKSASNLCKSCSIQLDSFSEFKTLCLEINERRKKYISKESVLDDSDNVVSIKTEVKPELLVSTELRESHQCSSCSESFDKKLELRKHEKKVHQSSTTTKKSTKRKTTDSKRKAAVSKRKTTVVKSKSTRKKSTKVKKKVDDSDDELDDLDFGGELNSNDGDEVNTTAEQNEKVDETKTKSPPKLSYKPDKDETTCRICARTLSSRQSLVNHIYHVHNNGISYKCTLCDAGFKYKNYLDRHMFRHTGTRSYICTKCGAKSITLTDLHDHMKIHQDLKKYSCDKCDKCFKLASGLRSHKIVVHTDPVDYKYACEVCGRKFPVKSRLDSHIPRHTSIKDFKCHVCPKEFHSKLELRIHMLSHTNVRNFKCDLCPEEFKQKHSLNIHKSEQHQIGTTARTPIKKLPCGYCGRLITAGLKLRRHERTHTGEKPYKCRLCDMRFICRSYIKGHLKGKHLIDVEVGGFDQKAYYESSTEDDVTELRPVTQGKARKVTRKKPSVIPTEQCQFAIVI